MITFKNSIPPVCRFILFKTVPLVTLNRYRPRKEIKKKYLLYIFIDKVSCSSGTIILGPDSVIYHTGQYLRRIAGGNVGLPLDTT